MEGDEEQIAFVNVDLAFPADYPDTPLSRKLRKEHGDVAGSLSAAIRPITTDFYRRLQRSYDYRGHGMDCGKKAYMHIGAFYVYPAAWDYQHIARPGELDAFKGTGRWMLCSAINKVLAERGLKPGELGITLEASGGECRYEESDMPRYEDYSDEDILAFFRMHFEQDLPSITEDCTSTPTRKALMDWLCVARDEMKLIEYYKTYGLVPIMGRMASAAATFMYGDAASVLRKCAGSPAAMPVIGYTGRATKRERPAQRKPVGKATKRRRM